MIELTPAIDRLFRTYYNYCTDWTEDSLFNLLTSLHSLDDKLNKRFGRIMFDIPEYIALKALRNHFHHSDEVHNTLRIKQTKSLILSTDLAYACLIPESSCVTALRGVNPKHQAKTAEAFDKSFKLWGSVVDINPCIFNCITKIFEALTEKDLKGASDEYQAFAEGYEYEVQHGHSHFVTGAFSVHPANADQVISMMQKLYEET